jgi:K+-transporting ATPase KdpF subunit
MKTTQFFSIFLAVVVPENSKAAAANNTISYILGAIIAILIMAYLIYSLIKPENF